MAKTPTTRRLEQRVKDPTGRLDLLVSRCIGEVVRTRKNPVLDAAWAELGPIADQVLSHYLGPRNRRAREIARYMRRGNEILRQQSQRRVAR